MHVTLVSPFDHLPAESARPGRWGNLSAELVRRGHRVTWLSSTFAHHTKRLRSAQDWQAPPGIRLVPVHAPPYPGNVDLRRLVSQGLFAWNARAVLRRVFRADDPPDVVVAASPPLLAPWLAGRIAREFGRPFVVDVIDLWPDAFERFLPTGWPTRALLELPRRFRDSAHLAPDVLVGVARDYLEHVAHPRPAVFHLGHDMSGFDSAWSEDWHGPPRRPDERWIAYVGTVSRNYDLEVVLHVAARFPHDTFWIVGEGEALPALRQEVTRLDLSNVRLPGRMPYRDLANLLARSEVGLLGLNALARIFLPYKTFDYLAAGLKVVTTVEGGELRELVEKERLGAFYREGDPDSLEAALRAALDAANPGERRRIRRLARERYSSAVIYSRYVDLLESLAPRTSSGDRTSTTG